MKLLETTSESSGFRYFCPPGNEYGPIASHAPGSRFNTITGIDGFDAVDAKTIEKLIKYAFQIGEPVETSIGTFSAEDMPDPSAETIIQAQRGPVTSVTREQLSKNGRWIWARHWVSSSVNGPGVWYLARAK